MSPRAPAAKKAKAKAKAKAKKTTKGPAELRGLESLLEDGVLLRAPLRIIPDVDAALDARDDPAFETEWLRVHDEAEAEFTRRFPRKNHLRLTDRVGELAFLQTYKLPDGSSLAPDISDDFRLIALALLTDTDEPWINALFSAYDRGTFPTGKLRRIRGRLRDLVEAAARHAR